MKYLIDTHIFLWLLFEPSKISNNKLEILKDINNQIYVSSISFWEISLKYSLGKLSLQNCLPDDMPSYAKDMGLEIIDANSSELASIYKLPIIHKDPFDRLIIYQAILRKFVLITQDSKFEAYKEHGLIVI